MTIEEAVQRCEQCYHTVRLHGKRAYFKAGLDRIKEYLEDTAREIQRLKAAQESVRVRQGAKRGRQVNLNPRDLAALPSGEV